MKYKNSQLRENIFKSWSPNMAWLLGYIYADGCIMKARGCNSYRLAFACEVKDVEILSFVKEFLNCSPEIRYCLCGNSEQYRLTVTSYELVKDLVEFHGLKACKSQLNLPFPNIPEEYLSHFVRGYFDGDGCIYSFKEKKKYVRLRLHITGTELFIRALSRKTSELIAVGCRRLYHVNKGSGKSFSIYWSCFSDIRKFYNWFYSDKTVMYLKRKEQKMSAVLYLGD